MTAADSTGTHGGGAKAQTAEGPDTAAPAPATGGSRFPATRLLVASFAVSLVAVLIYALAAGTSRHVESGDPFPGTVTATADVVGYFLGLVGAALVIGGLVFILTNARPDGHGIIDVSVYRAHLGLRRLALGWAVLAWLMVPVTAADASGTTPWRLLREGYLGDALGVSELAVAWIVVAVCATLIALLTRIWLSWTVHVIAMVPAGIAMCALLMAGNAGQGPNHDYTTGFGVLFALALGISLGFRCSWMFAPATPDAGERAVIAHRNAILLVISDAVTLITAVALVAFLLPARYVFSTAFGIASLHLLGLLIAVLGLSIASVRQTAAVRRGERDQANPLLVPLGAVALMVVAACWTIMDTRVAPGLLAHKFTGWDVFLGYELPGPPTVWNLATFWRFDVVFGVAGVLAAILYGVGVYRLRRRGDTWPVGRTVSWILGCLTLVVVTGSGIRAYGSAQFSIHMAEHMALNMFAPVLLVLGAPVTLALRVLPASHADAPPGPREWLLRFVHTKVTALFANPVFALMFFVISLYAVYFTPIFGTFTRYHWGHILLTLHFLITGYLFYWVIIGLDPGPRRIPFLARIGLLFAVMPFHAFFGIALMTMSTVVGDSFYSQLTLPWVTDRLHDQWLGGAIAWGASEIPVVLVVIAIVAQWAKSDRREAKRGDRHADTYEDTELDAYNAMLEELAKSRR
ncbi:cytochrome c oxidase assembly protein [Gordonia sp. NPDC003425]